MSLAIAWAIGFNTVVPTVCGFASFRGGRSERRGAAANLIAASATDLFRLANPAHLATFDLATFGIDLVVASRFFWLGVTTIRCRPI